MMAAVTNRPVWGANYDRGYIGFTWKDGSPVSEGIQYFTRWDRRDDVPKWLHPSHVLIVESPTTCIEAVRGKGVIRSPLDAYFNSHETAIVFRKPAVYSRDLGARIADEAARHVGEHYDNRLIAAHLAAGTFLGRMAAYMSEDTFAGYLACALNDEAAWICSELAAHCLDAQPELTGRGVLMQPAYAITPVELFGCDRVFKPWKQEAEQ